jgi:hypothetical protein
MVEREFLQRAASADWYPRFVYTERSIPHHAPITSNT